MSLREKYGREFERLHPGAIGVYSYFQRLAQGPSQLMCGARKFALEYIDRGDLASFTACVALVPSIPVASFNSMMETMFEFKTSAATMTMSLRMSSR